MHILVVRGCAVLRIRTFAGIVGFPIRGLHLGIPTCGLVSRDLGHFCRFDSIGLYGLLLGQRLVEIYGIHFGQRREEV